MAASSTTPDTETMTLTDARQQFSQIVNRVARKESRVLIEKNGLPVAAIVTADDLRDLDELDMRRQEEFAAFTRISDAFSDVPIDELEREVKRVIAETRAEYRAHIAKHIEE